MDTRCIGGARAGAEQAFAASSGRSPPESARLRDISRFLLGPEACDMGFACPAAVYACWVIGRKWVERHVELEDGIAPLGERRARFFNMARQVTRVALKVQGDVVG